MPCRCGPGSGVVHPVAHGVGLKGPAADCGGREDGPVGSSHVVEIDLSVAEFELPAHPAAVAWARAGVAATLPAWELDRLVVDCGLVTTELVAHAAKVAETFTVPFRLRLTASHLVVEVGGCSGKSFRWELG